ncbi:MAG: YhcN/YlaJ family sporulation lipoprotein [Tissierella sp.]|uniref:YhcN/YlaJ family sporulation lipoprotein n=1 Tax=Tissierella sp. TaxID=41274 RepID=UPI003F9BE4C8
MKKNKIMILILALTLMLTFTACTTKDPKTGRKNTNLSTQTRDNRWDRNTTDTDNLRDNTRDNMYMDDNINDRRNMGMDNPLDNDMDINNQRDGLDTNLNNGMTRPNDNLNNNMNKDASNVAGKITNLKEVNKASVLLSEKDAVIGVNLRGNTQDTMTNSLRTKIEDIVKKENKSIDNISITTDPNLVNRINTMYDDIDSGNMIDNFTDEVRNLIRKITPNTRK